MAKQCGSHPFTGKLGATIGYKTKTGEHIERENGSKEGKRFRRDPKRKRTMEYADMFGKASRSVKLIYRAIPKDQQQHGVYGKLSGKAFSMLRLGSSVEEVVMVLTKQYVEDKESLVEVMQDPTVQHQAAGSPTIKGNGQLAAGSGSVGGGLQNVSVPEAVTVESRQSYAMATIAKPYFCSTVSG